MLGPGGKLVLGEDGLQFLVLLLALLLHLAHVGHAAALEHLHHVFHLRLVQVDHFLVLVVRELDGLFHVVRAELGDLLGIHLAPEAAARLGIGHERSGQDHGGRNEQFKKCTHKKIGC